MAGEFAIDLQEHALIARFRRRYAPGAQHDDAPHAIQPVGDQAREIPHIAQRGTALEQDQLEMIVEQADIAGDLEIAAVVADFADQGKRAWCVTPSASIENSGRLRPSRLQPATQYASLPMRAFSGALTW